MLGGDTRWTHGDPKVKKTVKKHVCIIVLEVFLEYEIFHTRCLEIKVRADPPRLGFQKGSKIRIGM